MSNSIENLEKKILLLEEDNTQLKQHIQVLSDAIKEYLPTSKIEEFENNSPNEGWELAPMPQIKNNKFDAIGYGNITLFLFDIGYHYRLIKYNRTEKKITGYLNHFRYLEEDQDNYYDPSFSEKENTLSSSMISMSFSLMMNNAENHIFTIGNIDLIVQRKKIII